MEKVFLNNRRKNKIFKKFLSVIASGIMIFSAGTQTFAAQDVASAMEMASPKNEIQYEDALHKLSDAYHAENPLSMPSVLSEINDALPPKNYTASHQGSFVVSHSQYALLLNSQLIPNEDSYDKLTIQSTETDRRDQELIVMIDKIPAGDIYVLSIISNGQSAVAYGNSEVPAIVKLPQAAYSKRQDFEVHVWNYGSASNSTPYQILITRRYVPDTATFSLPKSSFYSTGGFTNLYQLNGKASFPASAVSDMILVKGTMKSSGSIRERLYDVKMSSSSGKEVTIYYGAHTEKVGGLSDIWSLAFDPHVYNDYCTFTNGSIQIDYTYDVLN